MSPGDNVLYGDSGSDVLIGGAGDDLMYGGFGEGGGRRRHLRRRGRRRVGPDQRLRHRGRADLRRLRDRRPGRCARCLGATWSSGPARATNRVEVTIRNTDGSGYSVTEDEETGKRRRHHQPRHGRWLSSRRPKALQRAAFGRPASRFGKGPRRVPSPVETVLPPSAAAAEHRGPYFIRLIGLQPAPSPNRPFKGYHFVGGGAGPVRFH